MAIPNLYSSTNTVNGRTVPVALANTSETTLLTNAASSNKSLRVRAITVNNVSNSGTVDVTLRYYNAASAGTGFAFPGITIPAAGSLIILGQENIIYLEEDRRLTIQASAGNFVTCLCSYEEITT